MKKILYITVFSVFLNTTIIAQDAKVTKQGNTTTASIDVGGVSATGTASTGTASTGGTNPITKVIDSLADHSNNKMQNIGTDRNSLDEAIKNKKEEMYFSEQKIQDLEYEQASSNESTYDKLQERAKEFQGKKNRFPNIDDNENNTFGSPSEKRKKDFDDKSKSEMNSVGNIEVSGRGNSLETIRSLATDGSKEAKGNVASGFAHQRNINEVMPKDVSGMFDNMPKINIMKYYNEQQRKEILLQQTPEERKELFKQLSPKEKEILYKEIGKHIEDIKKIDEKIQYLSHPQNYEKEKNNYFNSNLQEKNDEQAFKQKYEQDLNNLNEQKKKSEPEKSELDKIKDELAAEIRDCSDCEKK